MSESVVRAVAGLRGYGKSTLVARLTRGQSRVLYYDSLGDDYTDGVIVRDLAVLERFWRGVYTRKFRIVYRPIDPLGDLPRVCELAYACGNMVVVIDEIQLYFRQNWCSPELTKLITAGRHAGVELIGVTQAPKRLGELLRSQAHEWYVFAVREPTHAKYLAERMVGVDVGEILSLQKFEYLRYEDGAPCYWRCQDDLAGNVHSAEIRYETETPAPAPGSNPGADVDAGGAMGG
jgi:hypothetical protein